MKIKEFTGKTTKEAIDNGLAELGVTIADVHVDVLQEGAKGLFGLFGSKPACVRLTVMDDEREDDHGLSDLLGSFSLSDQKKKSAAKPAAPKPAPAKPAAPKAEAPKPVSQPEAPKTAPAKAEVKPEVKPAAPKAEAKPEISQEKPKAEAVPEKKPEALKPLRERKPRPPRPAREEGEKRDFEPMVPAETFAPTEPPVIHPEDTPAGRAQKFLMDVTDRMGVKVDVYVDESKADNLSIHMIGDTLGILIGRRGETLDALQYLTSLQVNKGREGYIRVTLDTENYRAKREDSLRRLAQRMANRAVKTGRRVVLEPMNPYERRVLHTALQNHPAVTTHSEGEEPNRRVVIMLKNQPERPEKERRKAAERQAEQPPPQQPPPRTAQAGQSGRKSACE
ncbi:MAG: RNA-binding cell elongation regulator Jag/EloR [Christensenellales bacterium]